VALWIYRTRFPALPPYSSFPIRGHVSSVGWLAFSRSPLGRLSQNSLRNFGVDAVVLKLEGSSKLSNEVQSLLFR
jgi:hypothetical protein